VENFRPAWQSGEEWVISTEPVLQIGAIEGPEEYQLFQVSDAVRRTDGTIAVGMRGPNSSIRVYSPQGVFLRQFGRTGEGPGEFRDLATLVSLGDGGVAALDRWRKVVSFWDDDGLLDRELVIPRDLRLINDMALFPSGDMVAAVPIPAGAPRR
jgi:hypothetical protein